jgi:hypothetical protein
MYRDLFLQGLAATVVTETALLVLLVRALLRIPQRDLSLTDLLACGVLCSSATLPYVWFVLPPHPRPLYILLAECFAVLAELGIIRLVLRISWGRAALLSLLCNLGSFALGEGIRALGVW